MKFKIVGDSCCDFTKEDLAKEYMVSVPLILTVAGTDIVDDETIDKKKMLDMIAESEDCAKSACPSPDAYMQAYEGADCIYVVTLSSKLSGSYNSAVIAKNMYLEEHPDAKIYIFDSKSAASAQHLIVRRIEALACADKQFETVVSNVEDYIKRQKTLFVLEDLETMRKNGRLSNVKAMVANVLNIKPVLCGIEGEIHQLDQARGMNKALNKLLWHIEKGNYDKKRKVEISYCECYERAMNLRKILMEQFGFEDVAIIEASGISCVYENRGGVVVSF